MNEKIIDLCEQAGLHLDLEQVPGFTRFISLFLNESINVMCKHDYHGEWLGSKLQEYFDIDPTTK